MLFEDLGLNTHVLEALKPLGYTEPTPIQGETIPLILSGRDVLGVAQTGTGKTAAFALPIVHQLAERAAQGEKRRIHALILSPTRELATQIFENFRDYSMGTPLRSAVIFGGVSQHRQVEQLRRGVDIVVATPGRLLDLVEQGFVHLDHLSHLVLDEADTMLDMGFIHDIRKIIKLLPAKRQSLFFSATMPDNIVQLADAILTEPIRVEVARVSSAAETVNQQVYFACQNEKRDLLVEILQRPEVETALVFTRTKHGADKVVRYLNQQGIKGEAIHGNKSQPQRDRAMNGFRQGTIKVLVATDIAARGIDVDALSHVINFEVPNIAETYVHRIGRTGRAGLTGHAITLCNEDEERDFLRDIQKLIQRELPVERYGSYPIDLGEVGMTKPRGNQGAQKSKPAQPKSPRGGNRGDGNRNQAPGGRRQPAGGRESSGQNPQRQAQGEGGRRSGSDRNQPAKRRMGARAANTSGAPQSEGGRRPSGNDDAKPKRRPEGSGRAANSGSGRNGERTANNGSGRNGERTANSGSGRNGERTANNGSGRNGERTANNGSGRNGERTRNNELREPRKSSRGNEPRQFGRSGGSTPSPAEPAKQKGFSLSSFFGFGKRED